MWILFGLVFFLPVWPAEGEEILTVLDAGDDGYRRWIDWGDPGMMLVHHLNEETRACLTDRQQQIQAITTAEQWKQRQEHVRRTLNQILGPWPERTELNAQVTGVIQKKGYRVEKIRFESMPKFYVTGALFIPEERSGPAPAILNVIGHSAQAFRRELYQNVILNLVHKGFVVLTIDPIGQGERVQYFDVTSGRSLVGGSTQEHSHAGIQCFLTGKSIARYFIWDGMRAIDYLNARPEVDSKRIGVTGLSGGGTQSSYIGAIDVRVQAVAPTGFITSTSRLLGSIGPQDAEQVFYRGPLLGIDHADLLEVRAPKPTLQVTTTRDFFSIQGARETAAEVQRAFSALGAPNQFRQIEDDYVHGFTPKNNEATYAFFQTALGLPGSPAEAEYAYLTPQELTVTSTGQVLTEPGAESVFTVNRREFQPLMQDLARRRKAIRAHLPAMLEDARRLSGYREPKQDRAPVFRGQYQREGYFVEKWGLPGEGKTIVPLLVFRPEGEQRRPAILYLQGEGKGVDAVEGGRIEALVRRGFVVAAPDLLGFGETRYRYTQGHGPVQPFFNALMSGRSVVGINAGDVNRVLRFVQARPDVIKEEIGAVAIGDTGPALLHAAAFEDEIRWVVLVDSLLSYASLVEHRLYQANANSLVAGALTAYDLPDLVASLAPRRVVLLNSRGPDGKRASREVVEAEIGFATRIAGNEIRTEADAADFLELILSCSRQ